MFAKQDLADRQCLPEIQWRCGLNQPVREDLRKGGKPLLRPSGRASFFGAATSISGAGTRRIRRQLLLDGSRQLALPTAQFEVIDRPESQQGNLRVLAEEPLAGSSQSLRPPRPDARRVTGCHRLSQGCGCLLRRRQRPADFCYRQRLHRDTFSKQTPHHKGSDGCGRESAIDNDVLSCDK